MTVGIVAQRGNSRARALGVRIAERVRERGRAVVFDETTGAALAEEREDVVARPVDTFADCALVVSIGGDGTFLYAARGVGSAPIMGVNLGEVGFLNAVAPEDAVETVLAAVDRIDEAGAPPTRSMPRLRATGSDWELPPALNEVVVHGPRRGHGGGATVEVRVDGSTYARGHADGVLVATSTGSTAYNLSEGGPLVHPSVDALVIDEMAPEDAMPPLAVDVDSEVTVLIEDAERGVAVSDGRARRRLDPPAEVRITRGDVPVRVAGPPRDFFAALGKLD